MINLHFFPLLCSGQGDTFVDPALLDNLREHHVSKDKMFILSSRAWDKEKI